MDATLLTALFAFLTALVPVLGTVLTLLINRSRLDAKDKALALALTDSTAKAVKSVAQTVTAHHTGNLSAELAKTAKSEALEIAKVLLGSEKLADAKAKYGLNGEVDKVLGNLLEAALHDVKGTKTTTSTSTSAVSPGGETTTSTQTKTTTAAAVAEPPALIKVTP